jgi:catechol 2,3-dioxygenase-like lactoylglutathione lyase family enzyme
MDSFVKLLVLDREASARFYEGLGFARVASDATFAHLRWAEHGNLFLVSAPTGVNLEGKRGWGALFCFTSTGDLAALAEKARGLSAPVSGPETQPWHTRELVVVDPDGYRLNFVAPA